VCIVYQLLTVWTLYAGIIHLVLFHNSVRTAARPITAADTSTCRQCHHITYQCHLYLLSIHQSTLLYHIMTFAVVQLTVQETVGQACRIDFLAWHESNQIVFFLWIGMHQYCKMSYAVQPACLVLYACCIVSCEDWCLRWNDWQKVDEMEGNVHSGARPPWLDADADGDATVESASIIGPTADDLHKHCTSFLLQGFVMATSHSWPTAIIKCCSCFYPLSYFLPPNLGGLWADRHQTLPHVRCVKRDVKLNHSRPHFWWWL